METLAVRELFSGAYRNRRVLVTGHTGFKGSWLCLWLRELGADVTGLALDPDTSPSHWDLLQLNATTDLRVDLRDAARVSAAVARARPEIVFHLAAQPLVRRGYREPVETFATNVTGLVHLYEALRNTPGVRAVVNATTDKVYREPPPTQGYAETHALGGHDPYSTSKACAELVTDCYRQSYFHAAGVRIASARAGNVIGGGDWSEDRLVPDFVRAAQSGNVLQLRNPDATRPWQHVLEPLSGYLALGAALLGGEPVEGAWNFGPSDDATLTVMSLAQQLALAWPGTDLCVSPGPHPHEAALLKLDCTKASTHLGWTPVWGAQTTIERTVGWYKSWHQHGELRSHDDLARYVDDARARQLDWT